MSPPKRMLRVFDRENRFGLGSCFSPPRCSEGSRVETSPRGRQIMISTMAKPNISMR
jgi:hypothetical protein